MVCWHYRLRLVDRVAEIELCLDELERVLEARIGDLRAVIDPWGSGAGFDEDGGIELYAPSPEGLDEALRLYLEHVARERGLDPARLEQLVNEARRAIERDPRRFAELVAEHGRWVEELALLALLVDEAQSEWEESVA